MAIDELLDLSEAARRLERSEWTVRGLLKKPQFSGRVIRRWGRLLLSAEVVEEMRAVIESRRRPVTLT